jgi:redox-sensitive bicupin YhaK (pirin superfamily)
MSAASVVDPRPVTAATSGIAVSEAGGAPLRRYLGTPEINQIDPFVLLDWFESEPGSPTAGFAPHPHRGFEAVTLMFEGEMQHRDNRGHAGVVGPGGLQWLRAGSGIIHGDLPKSPDGRLFGLQLWVNLPAAEKADEPSYINIAAAEVPRERRDGVEIRVLAGMTDAGTRGLVAGKSTEPVIYDVALLDGAVFSEGLPQTHNAFIAVIEGGVELTDAEGRPVTASRGTLLRLGPGRSVVVRALAEARFLLVAGKPIGEPVVRGGPFVMASRADVLQAFRDYQEGRFGPPISTSGAVS